MIKKLKRDFTRIALFALTVAMVFVTVVVNLANWASVRRELSQTVLFLAEARENNFLGGRQFGKNKHAHNLVSESIWFSVYFDEFGNYRMMNRENMSDSDSQVEVSLAEQAVKSGHEQDFLQDYLYQVIEQADGGKLVVFLNCETKISAVRTLALISLAACFGGFLLAWLIVRLASRKAVEPTIRNIEQQKQFITNASHELKTPLTVISTNMELLQMEIPENAWIKSTKRQTAQLRHLVEELVYLSRMEEENTMLVIEPLLFSELLEEAAEPFMAMAEFSGRELFLECEQDLYLNGDRASLQRLVSTLCDNAVKYASENGTIRIQAFAKGRHVVLNITNTVDQPLTKEQCGQLFRRFYRADSSRSKEKQNGFGIGLAIAAAISQKHGGEILARMTAEDELTFTCIFPKGGKGMPFTSGTCNQTQKKVK